MTIIKEITLAAGDRIVDVTTPNPQVASPADVHFNISVSGYGRFSDVANFGDTQFKRLFETAMVSEVGFNLLIGKNILESLLIEELGFTRVMTRPIIEQLAIEEALAKSIEPAVALETVTATELMTLLTTKDILEIVVSSETFVRVFAKTLTEQSVIVEILEKGLSVPKSETLACTELLAILYAKDIVELLTASETFVKAYAKEPLETVSLSESGVIQENDYVDLSYMDSLDYVNTKYYF